MGRSKIDYASIIDYQNLPRHIAIIMDGNGRWAQKRLMPRTMGHRAGMISLRKIVETCVEIKMSVLTVFAFSTENWKRPADEVDYLMRLLVEFLHKEIDDLHHNNVRIKVIGDYQRLPQDCLDEINYALERTYNNSGLLFNIAINYGARKELIRAVQNTTRKVLDGEISIEDIDETILESALYTTGIPDPDLLIRTAGEMRISNFLLWQIAYSELWFSDYMWPDFNREELLRAIWEYQQRDRRFGGLNVKQVGK